MWKPANFPRAAQLIVAMFDKGWFDDAVGRVEGFKIFGELMTSSNYGGSLTDSNLALILCWPRRSKAASHRRWHSCHCNEEATRWYAPRGPHEFDMSRNPRYICPGTVCNYMTDSFVGSVELTSIVNDSLTWLKHRNKNVQNRGVNILSALAQTGKHILRHPLCDR